MLVFAALGGSASGSVALLLPWLHLAACWAVYSRPPRRVQVAARRRWLAQRPALQPQPSPVHRPQLPPLRGQGCGVRRANSAAGAAPPQRRAAPLAGAPAPGHGRGSLCSA